MPTQQMDRKARKRHSAELEATALKIETLMGNLKTLERECAQLSRKINETVYDELTLLYINPESSKQWGIDLEAGDKIIARRDTGYPLDIQGSWFTLIQPQYVAMVKKGEQYFAIKDTVLVKAAARKEKSAGGLFIPESVNQQPTQGIITMAAAGQFTVGEEVVWSKKSIVEIDINGELLILLKQRDIIYAVSRETISLGEDWVTVVLENQKSALIIIPDNVRPKVVFGKVVHVGPEAGIVKQGYGFASIGKMERK